MIIMVVKMKVILIMIVIVRTIIAVIIIVKIIKIIILITYYTKIQNKIKIIKMIVVTNIQIINTRKTLIVIKNIINLQTTYLNNNLKILNL